MTKYDFKFINFAIETIKLGKVDKIWKDNLTVYKCGNIIRVDIKLED